MTTESENFEFTNDWFDRTAKSFWSVLIPRLRPKKILEIGSFEGRSTCWLIENMLRVEGSEIHCVDTWEGGVEHRLGDARVADMSDVEKRFFKNTKIQIGRVQPSPSLIIHKGLSAEQLPKLIVSGGLSSFDLIYIDGSHQTADVILDAVLSFKLCRVGGVLIFDDYLWGNADQKIDFLMTPKFGIDCFINTHSQKVRILQAPLYQIYAQKISE